MHYFNMGPWPVYVGFTTNRKAWKREMKRLGVKPRPPMILDDAHAVATTRHFALEGRPALVLITAQPVSRDVSWEAYAAIMAHEALHAVQYIRDVVNQGEQLGHETEAYLVQYITQSCLQIAYDTGRSIAIEPR